MPSWSYSGLSWKIQPPMYWIVSLNFVQSSGFCYQRKCSKLVQNLPLNGRICKWSVFFAFLGVIFKRFVNYISVLKNYSPRILLSVLKVCVVIPTKIFKNLTNFVGVLNKPRSAEVCASFRLKNSKSTSKRQGFSFD